ncbi:HAD family phosphatase [Dactylosporangium sp. NPDC051484]|uniref:HAD family hydrolase n=1 Tax=Dactylosporangium sp. NPDC051484 TaxID=3154942 RepID=UPI0034504725
MQAVLFDMDGTLVDSEKVWEVGLTELAAHHGRPLSAQARRGMIGTNMADSMRILHADLGLPFTRESMDYSVGWLEERVKALLRAGVPWRPGARELLAALRAEGVPLALVTATHRHLVDVALLTIGAENFDAVVAGDEVDQTKPHPMPYLTAARLVGAEARDCVAIEDSPNGIRSARAAGCAVLAVPCEVELDPEGVTLAGSLLDVDVDYLRKLVV